MRWCWFKLQLCWRILTILSTHISWILILMLNCVYFQMWKSYDLLWYWAHFALSLAIPTMRKSNIFVTCYRLIRGKIKEPSKSFQKIFRETVCAKTEFADAPAATESRCSRLRFLMCCCCEDADYNNAASNKEDQDGDVEMNGMQEGKTLEPGCVADNDGSAVVKVVTPRKAMRTHWGPINLKTLPPALDMALWLYRFRVTIALILGNTRQAVAFIDPPAPLFDLPATSDYRKNLWRWSMITLYVDVALIWFNIIQTYCRQCRMCCTVGVCRCIKYTICMIVFGIVAMELPMMHAQQRLDASWCAFRVDMPMNQSVIA